MQTAVNLVPAADDPEDEVGKIFPVRMQMNTVGWTARDEKDKIWPISHILVETEFTTEKTLNPVSTHQYTGGGKNYSIASADAVFGDHCGKIILIRNEDGTISVHWAPDNQR